MPRVQTVEITLPNDNLQGERIRQRLVALHSSSPDRVAIEIEDDVRASLGAGVQGYRLRLLDLRSAEWDRIRQDVLAAIADDGGHVRYQRAS